MNWESHSRFPTQKRVPHADQLLVAAAHGKLDVVQRLVEQDDALVDARSEYGLSALMQVYPSPSARHLVISSSSPRAHIPQLTSGNFTRAYSCCEVVAREGCRRKRDW